MRPYSIFFIFYLFYLFTCSLDLLYQSSQCHSPFRASRLTAQNSVHYFQFLGIRFLQQSSQYGLYIFFVKWRTIIAIYYCGIVNYSCLCFFPFRASWSERVFISFFSWIAWRDGWFRGFIWILVLQCALVSPVLYALMIWVKILNILTTIISILLKPCYKFKTREKHLSTCSTFMFLGIPRKFSFYFFNIGNTRIYPVFDLWGGGEGGIGVPKVRTMPRVGIPRILNW